MVPSSLSHSFCHDDIDPQLPYLGPFLAEGAHLMADGHFCERRLRNWRYVLHSIRSFDGLCCDGLALALARRRLGDAAVLWTQ